MRELAGYPNGGALPGIRKHIAVLSLNSFCNRAVELISESVRGTVPLVHPFGRNEIGVYRERLERSLEGIALHPNVHSLLLVGYEPQSTMEFLQTVKKAANKPVASVLVLEGGTLNAVRLGAEKALWMVIAASEARREPINF